MTHTVVVKLVMLLTAAEMIFGLAGCDRLMIPPPRTGVIAIAESIMINVPGGRVNADGGNLYIQREDISVDTLIGNWGISAVWNSAEGKWRWNFESNLRGITFTDETGARLVFNHVAEDAIVPGTHWVRHGPNAIRTRGGLVYHHDEVGAISSVNWISAQYPALHFLHTNSDLPLRVTSIEQCTSVTQCATLYTMTYDGSQRLTSIVDLAGRSVLYTYDPGSPHRVASVRDPLDVVNGWPGTRYGYDDASRLVSITNSHDERIEYTYFVRDQRTHV